MSEWIIGILFLLGGFFVFVAGLGVLRLPDVFTRMHASTKAGALGATFVLIGAAVHFGTIAITAKVVLTILFILLTAPIAAHMVGRAAQRAGVPMWRGLALGLRPPDLPEDELPGGDRGGDARPPAAQSPAAQPLPGLPPGGPGG